MIPYSIFAIFQILFFISMILSSVIGIKYRDSMTDYKFYFHCSSIFITLIIVVEIVVTFYLYFGDSKSFKYDIDDFILMISCFSSLFLTFLMTKAIILFLQMINSVVATIKREINLNSRGVKDQANYYENKLLNIFIKLIMTKIK